MSGTAKPRNKDKVHAPFSMDRSIWFLPMLFLFVMWFVYWAEHFMGSDFGIYGVYPRSFKGLRGIVFSPFIHGSIKHIYDNSVPLFVLLMMLRYFYRDISSAVLFTGTFLTGLFTWFIGRPSYHIGASGVIYMLVSFVFFSGVFRKYYRLAAASLLVVFLYGSMVWYIFPIKQSISWEGHLSGFIAGVLLAVKYRKYPPYPEQFEFSPSALDDYIDEEGNFVPPPPEVVEQDEKKRQTE